MSYTIVQPSATLKAFVSHFWMGRRNSEGQDSMYYSTANVLSELVFAFKPAGHTPSPLLFSAFQGQLIRQQQGRVTIPTLAAGCCLSQKQFERRFTATAGLSPKLYSRILRFESALWVANGYETLTEVAYAYGYFDQAHFIHECKQFSGFSPKTLFSLPRG